MKKIFNYTFVTIMCIIISINIIAQDNNCSHPLIINPIQNFNQYSINIQSTEYWVKFKATRNRYYFYINQNTKQPKPNIKKVVLYSGSCNAINLIKECLIDENIINLIENNLTINEDYYIKIEQFDNTNGIFDLNIYNILDDNPNCPPPSTCNLINNPGFEEVDYNNNFNEVYPFLNNSGVNTHVSCWYASTGTPSLEYFDGNTTAALYTHCRTRVISDTKIESIFSSCNLGYGNRYKLNYKFFNNFYYDPHHYLFPNTTLNFAMFKNGYQWGGCFVGGDHLNPTFYDNSFNILSVKTDFNNIQQWNNSSYRFKIYNSNIADYNYFMVYPYVDINFENTETVTYTYVDDIEVLPDEIVNFVGDTIIPCGGSTMITAVLSGNYSDSFGSMTWEWSNGSTDKFIIVNPTETTEYTCKIVYANRCTAEGKVKVYIKTNDTPVIESTSNNACNSQTYTIANFNPNLNYYLKIVDKDLNILYEERPMLSNSFIYDWNLNRNYGGEIIVSVESGSCISDKVLKVWDCCRGDNDTIINDGYFVPNSSTYINHNTIIFNGKTVIEGKVKFLDNTIIKLGPDASILVKNSGSLTSAFCTYKNCDETNMWDGIYIYGTSAELIFKEVFIRDAQNAINYIDDAQPGNELNNTTFTNNMNIISFKNCNRTVNIPNLNLRCNGDMILNSPQGFISNVALVFNNVKDAVLGDKGSVTIDGFNCGIKCINSNLKMYACTLKNIVGSNIEEGKGVLINNDNVSDFSVEIGNTRGHYYSGSTLVYYDRGNVFDNCDIAVELQNSMNSNIMLNSFVNCKYGVKELFLDKSRSSAVKYNAFNFCKNAVIFSEINGTSVAISDNTISNTYKGIILANVLNLPSNIGITNNLISFNTENDYSKTGIQTTNIYGDENFKTLIYNNNINLSNTCFIDNSISNYGIRLQNCNKSVINNNTVFCSANFNDTRLVTLLNGITIEESPDAEICSNTMEKLGSGIVIYGKNTNTQFIKNNMKYNYYGVRLQFADFSNQGNLDPKVTNDNKWYNPSISGTFRIYGSTTTIPKTWYYKTPGREYELTLNDMYFTYGSLNRKDLLNPTLKSCGYDPSINRFDAIISNQNVYTDYAAENIYLDKEYAYNTLKDEPATLQTLISQNPEYIEFYNETDTSNTGKLRLINDKIKNYLYENAYLENKALVPTNTIDEYKKTINQVYLETYRIQNTVLNPMQYDMVFNIALQSPEIYGDVVYSARVMLGIDGASMQSSRFARDTADTYKQLTDIATAKKDKFNIYPNPVNNIINIEYFSSENKNARLYICDFNGKIIVEKLLDNVNSRTEIQADILQNGVYFYKLITDKEIIKTDKIVIMH